VRKSELFTTVLTIAVSLLLVSSMLPAASQPPAAEKKPQTVCPIMGGKIDKEVYLDYQGQRVYFCCPGCKPKFLEDPEISMKKFEEQAILLESVQTACPVSGEPINKDVYTDYKGRRVYFCCKGCQAPFKKDPETHLAKLTTSKEGKKGGCGCCGK
jgi:YHS domain-containing protein